MVSPSSSNSTAAVPPSADTECERITCTFDTTPIFSDGPVFAASIAARSPARPEPTIIKSYSKESTMTIFCFKKSPKYVLKLDFSDRRMLIFIASDIASDDIRLAAARRKLRAKGLLKVLHPGAAAGKAAHWKGDHRCCRGTK
ncbi:hypothetical protein NUZ5A_20206 [Candidatus Nitrosotenuis uzonensis]|uniref:Uncharacterized protein n=1 Tax=Candidatus Nitrosotenuis uzonensis TaxID=1407055 RepID=A0A812EXP5_9ARCH|nr:hypothetical protein NUZ5A_20206 [Candidatus Nitrosotenuis uzonensis]